MINLNFKHFISRYFQNYSTSGVNLTMVNGNQSYVAVGGSNNDWGNTSYRRIVVGSGDTAPTLNDYELENRITDLTEIGTVSKPYNTTSLGSEDDYTFTMTTTYKNETENPITVKEIAMYIRKEATDNDSTNVMICREVINPVTIQPQQTYSFGITLG